MKGNTLSTALVLYIALYFKVTDCSNPLTKTPAKLAEIELDLNDKTESPNYKKYQKDDADHYVASPNKVFALVRSGENVLWKAKDQTEFATKVLVSEYGLTLVLTNDEHKKFRFEAEGLVEVGDHELPTTLYIDYTVSTYTHTCTRFNKSYMYQTTKYYRFNIVKMGQDLIYEAKTPEESAFLVSLSGNEITMYLLNENFKYFKFTNNGWFEYSPPAYDPDFDVPYPELDDLTVLDTGVTEADKAAEDDDSLSRTEIKNRLKSLDDELFQLKEQYEHFRYRLVSFNDTLGEVSDALGRAGAL